MNPSYGLETEPVEPLIAALAHPLRARILAVLTDRSATAGELATEVGEPPAKVRYHLRILARSKLIGLQGATRRRGAREQRWIAITHQVIQGDQLEQLSSDQVQLVTLYYLRLLFADASAAVRAGSFERRTDHCMVRFRPRVDEQGWSELVAIFNRAVGEAAEVTERCAERTAGSEEGLFPVGASLMLYEMAETTEAIPSRPLAE